ncbi:MAG TPA: hypothetical protein VF522_04060 [Ramlibacter sp.]|uniref:hypothetical protein n=1 Tax=Ramlibacter sp. TaxID=1917967 RepID=UPI002ED4C3FA
MDKVIVYLDDPAYAAQRMPAGSPTHWVLVACAPRMTHRISKWVSHSARENWRAKWADKLFDQVVPPLRARGDAVTPVLARGPLPELTRVLMAEHGTARVMDVRRPKAPEGSEGGRATPGGALLGLGLLLLAFD